MPLMTIVIAAIAATTVVALAVIFRAPKVTDREEMLSLAAHQVGMRFAALDIFDCSRLPFEAFRRGTARQVTNILWGEDSHGLPLKVFELTYTSTGTSPTVGAGQNQIRTSCATVEHGCDWPRLQILDVRTAGRPAGWPFAERFETGSATFDARFAVTCEDSEFASTLFDPQMIEFISGAGEQIYFEIAGGFVLAMCPIIEDMRLVPGLGRVADGFISHVPPSLRERRLGPPVADISPPQPPQTLNPLPGAGAPGPPVRATGDDNSIWSLLSGLTSTSDPEAFEFAPMPDHNAPNPWDPTPGIEHDLDGKVVPQGDEDPWGEGREVPDHHRNP